MRPIRAIFEWILGLYVAFVFIQSLFFKFTGSAETDHIFGTLDKWAAGLGFPGLFAPNGIFSPYLIGTAELFASILILIGLLTGRGWLRGIGALMGLGIITGAIFFHLFTPLGIVVQDDGGLLFGMAVGVWVSCALLVLINAGALLSLIRR